MIYPAIHNSFVVACVAVFIGFTFFLKKKREILQGAGIMWWEVLYR